jgi:hypothetical protein
MDNIRLTNGELVVRADHVDSDWWWLKIWEEQKEAA